MRKTPNLGLRCYWWMRFSIFWILLDYSLLDLRVRTKHWLGNAAVVPVYLRVLSGFLCCLGAASSCSPPLCFLWSSLSSLAPPLSFACSRTQKQTQRQWGMWQWVGYLTAHRVEWGREQNKPNQTKEKITGSTLDSLLTEAVQFLPSNCSLSSTTTVKLWYSWIIMYKTRAIWEETSWYYCSDDQDMV